ncbi:MAG: hypothetical protein KGJ07_02490, partial [Patescibacteria group bacterium]|nr:hypothetical protein [Patescibacteria group bacterium]
MQLLRKKKVLLGFSLVLLYTSIFLLQKDFVLAVEDLGRHLVLGKIIVTCHCIPKTNLLSFTNPNFPFINHHWFSEVIFYLFSGVFGINSLLVLKSAIIITCISI